MKTITQFFVAMDFNTVLGNTTSVTLRRNELKSLEMGDMGEGFKRDSLPSEIELIFSRALAPDLKGTNDSSLTTLPNLAKSNTAACT